MVYEDVIIFIVEMFVGITFQKLRGMFPPIQDSKMGWTSLSIFSLFTDGSFQSITDKKIYKILSNLLNVITNIVFNRRE